MRIKRVVEADFRWSEVGIWLKFLNKKKGKIFVNRAFITTLKDGDVVLFISKTGNQLLFVHGFENLRNEAGDELISLPSSRHRIIKGTWSHHMLANYAREAKVPITGLKTFEQHFSSVRDRTVRRTA